MQRTQINNYRKGEITRLDTDVLARLCTVLECEIGDLLEFVPLEKECGCKIRILVYNSQKRKGVFVCLSESWSSGILTRCFV